MVPSFFTLRCDDSEIFYCFYIPCILLPFIVWTFFFFSFHEVYDGARIRRKPVVVSTDEGGWARERAAVNCTFSSISHGKRWINRISPKGIRGARVMVAAPLGTEPHLVYSTVEWDTGISADKFKLSFRWHEKAGRQNVEADAQHKNKQEKRKTVRN